MTNRQIETSREIRQWIKGVIVPTVAACLYIDYKYPNLKYGIRDYVKSKFERKEKTNE